jgi:cell division septal protein FtsQ
MAWDIFKRNKSRPGRFALNSRRVSGVVTGLPNGVRFAIGALCLVLFSGVAGWGGWKLFEAYYFHSKSLFVLKDLQACVTINTGKTLTPDLICEILQLHNGMNLFSLSIEQKRSELLEQAPNIRDIAIVRRMPDKLTITISEREPIARVGANGQVVDEEGVVFVRYAGTGGLPMIRGSDLLTQIKPGDRLRGKEKAAVRLVQSALRPECRLRLLVVDTAKDDYLLVTLSDHRQAKIAWDGMSDDEKDTQVKMQRQFDQLALAMESDIGRGCLLWDATIPGRIFATAPGVQ